MWAQIIPSAISVLGGLFGGKAPTIPYTNQIQGALGSAGVQASNISNLASQAQNAYNQFSPQANAAIENYARYLQQNPYTSAYSTALLNRATSSTTASYQQAKSQLQADLASRGMLGSGYMAGTLGAVDVSQAQALASAQNNLALQDIGQLSQNQADLVGLFSGAANGAYGQATTGYGNAAGIYDSIASQYEGLGEAQQKDNIAQQQYNQGLIQSGLTGLGSAFGTYLDGGFKSPAANNAGAVTQPEQSGEQQGAAQRAQQLYANQQNTPPPAVAPAAPFNIYGDPYYSSIFGPHNNNLWPTPTLSPYIPPGATWAPLQAPPSIYGQQP